MKRRERLMAAPAGTFDPRVVRSGQVFRGMYTPRASTAGRSLARPPATAKNDCISRCGVPDRFAADSWPMRAPTTVQERSRRDGALQRPILERGCSIDVCEPPGNRFTDSGYLPLEMCDVRQRQPLGELDLDEVLELDALLFRGAIVHFFQPALQSAQEELRHLYGNRSSRQKIRGAEARDVVHRQVTT